jgi:hypothetical protein
MSEDPLNRLESALRRLTPSAEPLDRDALLYEAGRAYESARAAVPPPRWPWPLAAAVSAMLAVAFGIALLTMSARVVERVVYPKPPLAPPQAVVPPPMPPPAPEQPPDVPSTSPWDPDPTPYEQARDNVLRWGLDGLPPAPPARPQTLKADQLIRPF